MPKTKQKASKHSALLEPALKGHNVRTIVSKMVSSGQIADLRSTGFIAPEQKKETNPKDAIATDKLPIHLVPDSMEAYAALAFCEGALNYGSTNWRERGARASVYKSALERHVKAYWNGEWAHPTTKVPHLASALACIAIILDTRLAGTLVDDRPPRVRMREKIEEMSEVVAHLRKIFPQKKPGARDCHIKLGDDAGGV